MKQITEEQINEAAEENNYFTNLSQHHAFSEGWSRCAKWMQEQMPSSVINSTEKQIEIDAEKCARQLSNDRSSQFDIALGYRKGAERMQEQMQPEWIAVSEGLPESGDTVLIWQENLSDTECSRFQKAVYFTGYFKIYPHMRDSAYKAINDFEGYDLEGDTCKITHWMQSPKSPISQ